MVLGYKMWYELHIEIKMRWKFKFYVEKSLEVFIV